MEPQQSVILPSALNTKEQLPIIFDKCIKELATSRTQMSSRRGNLSSTLYFFHQLFGYITEGIKDTPPIKDKKEYQNLMGEIDTWLDAPFPNSEDHKRLAEHMGGGAVLFRKLRPVLYDSGLLAWGGNEQ